MIIEYASISIAILAWIAAAIVAAIKVKTFLNSKYEAKRQLFHDLYAGRFVMAPTAQSYRGKRIGETFYAALNRIESVFHDDPEVLCRAKQYFASKSVNDLPALFKAMSIGAGLGELNVPDDRIMVVFVPTAQDDQSIKSV